MYLFRQALEDDYQDICELITSPEELYLVYPSGVFPLTIEKVEEISQKRHALTVMELQEEVIGFANLYNMNVGESAFIGNVVIRKDQRGNGLGKKLLEYMIGLAEQEYSVQDIRLSVFSENKKALSLYNDLGFREYGYEDRVDPFGRNRKLIHMSRIC